MLSINYSCSVQFVDYFVGSSGLLSGAAFKSSEIEVLTSLSCTLSSRVAQKQTQLDLLTLERSSHFSILVSTPRLQIIFTAQGTGSPKNLVIIIGASILKYWKVKSFGRSR